MPNRPDLQKMLADLAALRRQEAALEKAIQAEARRRQVEALGIVDLCASVLGKRKPAKVTTTARPAKATNVTTLGTGRIRADKSKCKECGAPSYKTFPRCEVHQKARWAAVGKAKQIGTKEDAVAWARANPGDPRATKILALHAA